LNINGPPRADHTFVRIITKFAPRGCRNRSHLINPGVSCTGNIAGTRIRNSQVANCRSASGHGAIISDGTLHLLGVASRNTKRQDDRETIAMTDPRGRSTFIVNVESSADDAQLLDQLAGLGLNVDREYGVVPLDAERRQRVVRVDASEAQLQEAQKSVAFTYYPDLKMRR
jgi:hypothetical protein